MKKIVSYLLPPLLFSIDILLLGLLQQNLISTLLCFYAITLMRPTKFRLLATYLFFLSTISLIVYGIFGLSLLYLLPLSVATLEAKKLLSRRFWLPYALVGLSLLAQELLIGPFLLEIPFNTLFTGAKLCVNLVLVLIVKKLLK